MAVLTTDGGTGLLVVLCSLSTVTWSEQSALSSCSTAGGGGGGGGRNVSGL